MGPPKIILIVEDELDLRELIRDILQMLTCRTVTVSNGREALEYLEAGELPSLIILDLMMPEINGWEFRERIQDNPAWANIPLMLVSGVSDVALAARQIQAVAFVSKPFNIPEFLDLVGRYC